MSIGENGGDSTGGEVSIGEFVADVTQGCRLAAKGLAFQNGLPVIGLIGPSSCRTLGGLSSGDVGGC